MPRGVLRLPAGAGGNGKQLLPISYLRQPCEEMNYKVQRPLPTLLGAPAARDALPGPARWGAPGCPCPSARALVAGSSSAGPVRGRWPAPHQLGAECRGSWCQPTSWYQVGSRVPTCMLPHPGCGRGSLPRGTSEALGCGAAGSLASQLPAAQSVLFPAAPRGQRARRRRCHHAGCQGAAICVRGAARLVGATAPPSATPPRPRGTAALEGWVPPERHPQGSGRGGLWRGPGPRREEAGEAWLPACLPLRGSAEEPSSPSQGHRGQPVLPPPWAPCPLGLGAPRSRGGGAVFG